MSTIRFVIITGLSGAGKSQTAKCFEDIGYFCVDNLPTTLIPTFTEVCARPGSEITKVALVIDVREGELLDNLLTELDKLNRSGYSHEILFLDASTESLIHRYSETRRKHPFDKTGPISAAIEAERERLAQIKSSADWIIDTSPINVHQLREQITKIFGGPRQDTPLVSIISFGFKHGVPAESDLVFDVRFLPNPNYVDGIKAYTGNDKKVQDYVLKWAETKTFMSKLEDMVSFLLPNYHREQKSYVTIALGCTGGKHRSVVLANVLKEFLDSQGHDVKITHRDVGKE